MSLCDGSCNYFNVVYKLAVSKTIAYRVKIVVKNVQKAGVTVFMALPSTIARPHAICDLHDANRL